MIEFIVVLIVGYILGRFSKPENEGIKFVDKMWKSTKSSLKDKPTPGVVRSLTPEELAEKHDPIKQGNKEAFDRFFREIHLKSGEFQLFNLKDRDGKKTEDYICRVCKEIYGMMRPKIGNVSKIYNKENEVKIKE